MSRSSATGRRAVPEFHVHMAAVPADQVDRFLPAQWRGLLRPDLDPSQLLFYLDCLVGARLEFCQPCTKVAWSVLEALEEAKRAGVLLVAAARIPELAAATPSSPAALGRLELLAMNTPIGMAALSRDVERVSAVTRASALTVEGFAQAVDTLVLLSVAAAALSAPGAGG